MNKLLLPFCAFALSVSAQQTIHSVANGNATNPFIWDCTCFPTTDDHIFVDHNVVMNTDWAITSGGSIDVAASGSLMQDADRQLLVDGTGSEFNVYGSSSFRDIAFTNGASGYNDGTLSVDRALYTAAGTTFINSAHLGDIDSLLTSGNFTNSGDLFSGNFLNTGTFTNTGHILADSLGNTGNFSAQNGYVIVSTFGNNGTYTMQTAGFMEVEENWYNAENFTVGAGRELTVGGGFYTGDTILGTALLVNNGLVAVTGDFGNSEDMNGSGKFCVGGASGNSGAVTGTLDFCDNSGTGNFDINLGTIAGSVTNCGVGACFLSLEEQTKETINLYPNPATTLLNIETNGAFTNVHFYSVRGELVQSSLFSGTPISISGLPAGIYFVQLEGATLSVPVRLVVE